MITLEDLEKAMAGRNESDIGLSDIYWKKLHEFRMQGPPVVVEVIEPEVEPIFVFKTVGPTFTVPSPPNSVNRELTDDVSEQLRSIGIEL